MNNTAIAALLGLNIVVTGGLGALLLKQSNPAQQTPSETASAPQEIKVDIADLEAPLNKVSQNIEQLTETVQRFSTSYVQYDFLKREMDRLAVVDQTIGVRAQATARSQTDENTEEVQQVIGKLGALSQQVKGQLQTRRQTMLRLISGLEKELAQISSTPLTTPAPQPAPAPAPEDSQKTSTEADSGEE